MVNNECILCIVYFSGGDSRGALVSIFCRDWVAEHLAKHVGSTFLRENGDKPKWGSLPS